MEALRWQAALLEELGAGDAALAAFEVVQLALQEQGASTLEWNALLETLPLAAAKGDSALIDRLETRRRELEQRQNW